MAWLAATPTRPLTVATDIPERFRPLAARLEARLGGRPGIVEARRKFLELVRHAEPATDYTDHSHAARRRRWIHREACSLAARAGLVATDEAHYTPGDHVRVLGLDYVPPWESRRPPYLDGGGCGLALVEVTRERVYRRTWRSSQATTVYLVGVDDDGEPFAHPVGRQCYTVADALLWVWDGYVPRARQGHLAIVYGRGPKRPPVLPPRHRVEGGLIVHPSHAPLRLPAAGERLIVGRRAHDRLRSAAAD